MKTVKITEGHTGYPSGKKRVFKKGEVVDVANDYADLITSDDKKLAVLVEEKAQSAPETPKAAAAPAQKRSENGENLKDSRRPG